MVHMSAHKHRCQQMSSSLFHHTYSDLLERNHDTVVGSGRLHGQRQTPEQVVMVRRRMREVQVRTTPFPRVRMLLLLQLCDGQELKRAKRG
jgi:hypothetical protein